MTMTKVNGAALGAWFKAKLAESGITLAIAKQLGLKQCNAAEAGKLKLKYAAPGFKIPYFDARGKPLAMFRYRYQHDPRPKLQRLVEPRALRYLQPAGLVPDVYLPRVRGLAWADYLKDAAKPLFVTEGELKASCATLHGFATVGLGGVWSWKSTSHGLDHLPWFEQVAWTNRAVYLVFDSDAVTNPMVLNAEYALAKYLLLLGADVYVVRLPGRDDRKLGLDDYLVAYGAKRFKALLDATEEFKLSQALHELNGEVIYVKNPGLIYDLNDRYRLSCADFVNHAYADRKFVEQQPMPNGGVKLVSRSLPKAWLEWPGRLKAKRLAYVPGQPLLLRDGALNTWPGWNAPPLDDDCALWVELLDHLCAGASPEDRAWLERWLAYPLQHPGTKMYSAVVLWGRHHGTGKSLVGYTMREIYGSNFTEMNDRSLKSDFTEWAEDKQFAMGDDITSGDKRGIADHLKYIITRKTIRMNIKHIRSHDVDDRINYFFTSNHCDSFFLEDDDRRYFVIEVTEPPLDAAFYSRYDAWLKSGCAGPAVFARLLQLDLGDFNPNGRAPMTTAKAEMTQLGRSDLAKWVDALHHSPETVLRVGDIKLTDRALWTSEDLLNLYDPDGRTGVKAQGVARALKQAGFSQVANGQPVRVPSKGQQRLWVVTQLAALARLTPQELGVRYDKERGEVKARRLTKKKEK